MKIPDISALTLSELLYLQSRIGHEIGRRGVSRTSGSVQGEIGEALALAVYGGVLPPPGTRGHDLTDALGRKIQVKTRTLPRGVQRIFQFNSAVVDSTDFDLALCIRFDRETNELDWAREYTKDELLGLLSQHKQGPRLPTGRAQRNGTDVTAKIRMAYEALGG
ncbi:DUF6998 domain-containing protein [Arthrobacter sp. ZGTC212]|uniref:DUF6998 domain-containing protein n=1 Tax=Arthrobacter sp. ZGTC212 TaxID=2058899 RepID=UPI0011B033C5|nr:hypothetical protein [Arthrobacter sp. ZGTC212]